MDLSDQILLRGWINHLEWSELDEQLNDDTQTAKAWLKRLRQQLVIKARYYGKVDAVELWSGDRLETETWRKRSLKSLDQLKALPDPLPELTDNVAQWFTASQCAILPLIRFFDEHALHLGFSLNKTPKSSTLPVPLENIAPLDSVLIPLALNGEHGSNRSPLPCRIDASHDLDAIKSWLSLKDGNTKTVTSYKKELERLLLWALLERGKALSSLNTDDCKAYIRFLQNLTIEDSQWVAVGTAIKGQGTWKPFYCRLPKGGIGAGDDDTLMEPLRVLSPRSVNYAKTVISSCMDWLVKQHYLQHNNFDSVTSVKFAQSRTMGSNRAFTLKHMQAVFAYAEARIDPALATFLQERRTLYILKLAFSTGLRIHELAAASFGDIETLDGEEEVQYFIKVVGKNTKERRTSLPKALVEELRAFLRLRGLPTEFGFLPLQAPLIPSLRDKTGRKHLTPAGIHKILANFFTDMAASLEADENTDPRFTEKLNKASTHWLRHSYGSYLANDKQVPLAYIRDELGHANISTTSLYLDTDAKQRQKVVSEAFAEV